MEFDPTQMTDSALLQVLCGPVGLTLTQWPLTEIFGFCKPPPTSLTCSDGRPPCPVIEPVLAAKELITRAMAQTVSPGVVIRDYQALVPYLRSRIGNLTYEVFWCFFLNARCEVISSEEMFRGTLSECAIAYRQIVHRALHHNAAHVILAHNHTSRFTTPSDSDIELTKIIKAALALVDVKVLDHLIVSGTEATSMNKLNLV